MKAQNLLVVEDESVFAFGIQVKLEQMGYKVVGSASNGELAVKLAEEFRPDVVLMDIHLRRGMDGIRAAQQIWSQYRIPVIYMTAFADDDTLEQAKIAEPYGYLVKPFKPEDMHTTIQVALNRHAFEKKLSESEARFRLLFETMAQGVICFSLDGQIVSANPAASHILGLTAEELLERSLSDPRWQVVQEDGTIIPFEKYPVFLAAQSGQKTSQPVMGIYNPSLGKMVWININAVPQFLPGEAQPYQIYTTFADITERKQNETMIQANAQLLENQKNFINHIIDSIPSSLLVIDRSMRIVSANRNFMERTRRDTQSTLGLRIDEVFPKALLDYTQLNRRIKEVIQTGQTIEGGKVAYHAPGISTHIYFYRLIPLYPIQRTASERTAESDRVENVLLLMDDITEREQLGEEIRRTERHLASIVECANELVVSLDPQGLIVTWNHAAEMISGFKSEQVKSVPLASLCTTEHQQRMVDMLHLPTSKAKQRQDEINLLTATGQEVPIAWSCSPMRDDAGAVTGIVVVGRNLAEQRRLEEQLIISDKLAALGVMAGGIAHELRNPLGIISASAQLLLESPKDVPLRTQGLQKIDTAAKRASLIIENLLKFSRPNWQQTMDTVNLLPILGDRSKSGKKVVKWLWGGCIPRPQPTKKETQSTCV